MNDNETQPREPADTEQADTEQPVITEVYTGDCPSLSERSTLTFAIGQDDQDMSLHLRITGNSGGGMWCKDWASGTAIDEIALGANELTAKSFNALHKGRSTNTGGFYLAALRTMGLLQVREDNARFHAHVPATEFASVAKDYMASAGKTQKLKRRTS